MYDTIKYKGGIDMTEEELYMAYQNYLLYQKELEGQRKWFEKYPLIKTGKLPREDFHDKFLPHLHEEASRNGLCIKLVNMVGSLDSVNENIVKLFENYEYICNNNPVTDGHNFQAYRRNYSLCSYIIADIRRFIDDMISICWCLSQREEVENILVDDIGRYLKSNFQYNDFEGFEDFLQLLNDLSNSYKHSTTNNMQMLIGRDEPCIYAFYARFNKNISNPEIFGVTVRELVAQFNEFYDYSFHLIEEKCKILDKEYK